MEDLRQGAGRSGGGGDGMKGPAKLRKKTTVGTPAKKVEAKPKPTISRSPLTELNNGRLPTAHRKKGSKGGCFGFLLPDSSSSSSVSSIASSSSVAPLRRSRSLPRTPQSAPLRTGALGPLDALGAPPGVVRSAASRRNVARVARPSFGNLKQSRTGEQQRPTSRSILQWRSHGRAGSEGRPLQKKGAGGRGRRAAIGELKGANFEVTLEDGNGPLNLDSTPGKGALADLVSEVCLGFGLEEGESPPSELSQGSVLDATPGKEVEEQQQGHQLSHTPVSTRTATPPVQASISPELGTQSALPTPACFAAGHLITGVQDRRKCRPRGILNGAACAVEIAEGRGLRSSDAPRNGCRRVSVTPPPPFEASVQWLSSPCDRESGRSRSGVVSSSSKKVPLGACHAEASVNWFLSPLGDATDACVLEDGTPSVATETTGNSTEFGSSLGMNSSYFENTPSAVEICCSPTTNSSVSPFSLIIQKAAASAMCRDRGKRRHRYGSVVNNSLFSEDSHGSNNVIRTPSSCSCSSRRLGPLDLQAMEGAVQALNSSSPLWKVLSSESKYLLSLSPPRFLSGGLSTPSNSISLSCFRRPSRRQNSVKEESYEEERLSSSQMRISWRKGLISRIFEMDEFDHNPWSSDQVNVHSQGEDELSSKPDTRFGQNLGSSMSTEVTNQFTTNGFGSFEFVGHKQLEKREAMVPSPRPISFAESLRIEVDELVASDDSDWNIFKNKLFEV